MNEERTEKCLRQVYSFSFLYNYTHIFSYIGNVGKCHLRQLWLFCLVPLVYCSQTLLNYLTFQYFDIERIWWRLFQKRVVRTKSDIYVCLSYSHVGNNWMTVSPNWYLISWAKIVLLLKKVVPIFTKHIEVNIPK